MNSHVGIQRQHRLGLNLFLGLYSDSDLKMHSIKSVTITTIMNEF